MKLFLVTLSPKGYFSSKWVGGDLNSSTGIEYVVFGPVSTRVASIFTFNSTLFLLDWFCLSVLI